MHGWMEGEWGPEWMEEGREMEWEGGGENKGEGRERERRIVAWYTVTVKEGLEQVNIAA